MPEAQKVCIVVPTYNERENIEHFINAVRAVCEPETILFFVDDSSPDGTADLIREKSRVDSSIELKVREKKMGIGSAYQEGFHVALVSFEPSVLVQMDADLQHPPEVVGELVSAVREGADVAVASRYVKGGASSGWSFWRRLVSRTANAYARTLLRLKVKDATSGFRAYSRKAAEAITEAKLPAKGFEFQVASIRILEKKGMTAVEVPYTFQRRKAGSSKLGLSGVMRFFFAVLRLAV